MHPDQNRQNQPGQLPPMPDTPQQQPLPQYPSPYPPAVGQQSWQRPTYHQTDPTRQLPSPQMPGQQPASTAPAPALPASSVDYAALATDRGSSKKKAVAIALLTVVLLLGLGVGAYFAVDALRNGRQAPAPEAKTQQETPAAVSMATLPDVTLLPPDSLGRYAANPENTELVMAYNTEGNACSLQLGVVAASVLPGKDLTEIVAQQIKAMRDQGVKVDDPTKGDTLTLKNVTDASKQYTLPTLVFVATDTSGRQVRSHYSAAVLKNGNRAYVTRTCQVASGVVDAAALKPLDDDARGISVRVR